MAITLCAKAIVFAANHFCNRKNHVVEIVDPTWGWSREPWRDFGKSLGRWCIPQHAYDWQLYFGFPEIFWAGQQATNLLSLRQRSRISIYGTYSRKKFLIKGNPKDIQPSLRWLRNLPGLRWFQNFPCRFTERGSTWIPFLFAHQCKPQKPIWIFPIDLLSSRRFSLKINFW